MLEVFLDEEATEENLVPRTSSFKGKTLSRSPMVSALKNEIKR